MLSAEDEIFAIVPTNEEEEAAPRKKGKPSKDDSAKMNVETGGSGDIGADLDIINASIDVAEKRGRGRPKKVKTAPSLFAVKKSPGRPKGSTGKHSKVFGKDSNVAGIASVDRGEDARDIKPLERFTIDLPITKGKKKVTNTDGSPRGRGRPRKDGSSPVKRTPKGSGQRGRPKGSTGTPKSASSLIRMSLGSAKKSSPKKTSPTKDSAGSPVKRGRGRPKKGEEKKKKGKRGRPKKSAE